MEPTKDTFDARAAALDELLGTGRSFDMVTRPLTIAGRRARLWVVNGYAEDALLARLESLVHFRNPINGPFDFLGVVAEEPELHPCDDPLIV